MNKIHNPCIQTFRAFHSKFLARILPNQQCCLHWNEKQSARLVGKQDFHFSSSHNGVDLRSTASLNDRERNYSEYFNQSKRLYRNANRRFTTTAQRLKKHEKEQREYQQIENKTTGSDNEGRNLKDGGNTEHTESDHLKEHANSLNNVRKFKYDPSQKTYEKSKQKNVGAFENPFNAAHNTLTENFNNLVNIHNKSSVFASAHEEFQEILKNNPTGSKVVGGYNAPLDKEFGDDKVEVSDRGNLKREVDSEETISHSIGRRGRKMQVGLQFETEVAFSYDDVVSFGKLSRDWNPIHYYPDDGRVKHLARIFRVRSLDEIEGKIPPPPEDDSSSSSSPLANSSTSELKVNADQQEVNASQEKHEHTISKSESNSPQVNNSEDPPSDDDKVAPPHVPIIPGALLNNLISGVMGTQLPGPGTLILHQTLNYKNMAFVQEKIRIRVRVTAVRKMLVTATYKAWTMRNDERVVILTGDAKLVYRST